MSAPAMADAAPQGVGMPRFIRDSLRARIFTGIGIMLLPLLGLAIAALLGIDSVKASFREAVGVSSGKIRPTMHLEIVIQQAAMPANDYLIHGESTERDKFFRLSKQVESAFTRLETASFALGKERALIGSAREDWRQARSISETLLALPWPVGDPAAASEMKRMDEHIDRAINALGRFHNLAGAEIDGVFARATATARTVLWVVFGVFALGFLVAASAGAALARSILARVKALSDGARTFGEGNFSNRVQLQGHDELGRLASVFNTMAAELEKTHQALREASIRDPLTGLYNRREFDRRLGEEMQRCDRYRRPLSLLMLDLDHFKAINDGYGHPVGDKVLREIADVISNAVRGADEVARYGGEEIAAILPETDKPGAGVLAQRIREAVAAHTFWADESRPVTVKVSIGLAVFPDDANCVESLIAAADNALYDAKRAGRNCVRSFGAEPGAERRQ